MADAQTLARAAVLCAERGVRLTAQRRRVLEILCGSARPVGAYAIMDALREGPRVVAPPTVYRALDFLLEQGLIHKLQSLHAYVGCRHPERPHLGGFLICLDCGSAAEIEDAELERGLERLASGSGFAPRRQVIEVMGTCADCAERLGAAV
jgi:Fur family transcriptional regulator, zinc uptake regulator